MNNADAMPFDEAQIQILFDEAGWVETPAPDMKRVEEVLQRAMHESIIKDTTSFVFKGFPAVISSLMSVAAGSVPSSDVDYRV